MKHLFSELHNALCTLNMRYCSLAQEVIFPTEQGLFRSEHPVLQVPTLWATTQPTIVQDVSQKERTHEDAQKADFAL